MNTLLFCPAAFLVCLLAGNRSLRAGLFAVLSVGYGYGILRANFPDTMTYLTFDAAVLGLYCAQLWRPLTEQQRRSVHDLRLWLTVLIAWPTFLFFVFPSDSRLVELVGLRANIFLLPFLLLGVRLSSADIYWLAVRVAFLNIAAVSLGAVEFFVGIQSFYPQNEVTALIYRSNDLLGRAAYRIPASFANAHVFAGTMVTTLPILIGAWSRPFHEVRWQRPLLAAAVVACLLGVFMAATRTHMITAALLVAVATFSGQLRGGQLVRWILALALVGYVVSGHERLQRFTTLQDTGSLAERWKGSVNEGFFELVKAHPLGDGLAVGGTSVPYFLQGRQSPMLMENEYARIALEQGIPGLTLWAGFILWVFFRWPRGSQDDWLLGRRLGWVDCMWVFFSALTGIGMLTSVPQTALLLLTMGWFLTANQPRTSFVQQPLVVAPRRPSPIAGVPLQPRAGEQSIS